MVWCFLRPGQHQLPAGAEYGLASHLRQYPDLSLATPEERAAAETVREQARAAAQPFARLAAARRAGYDLHVARKQPAVLGVLHAENKWKSAGRNYFDPTKPKALIYARQPGRPLVLIGVMFSMPRGILGPDTLGPIGRWHSHLVCFRGDARGLALAGSYCPAGRSSGRGARCSTSGSRTISAARTPSTSRCRSSAATASSTAETCAKHPRPLGM